MRELQIGEATTMARCLSGGMTAIWHARGRSVAKVEPEQPMGAVGMRVPSTALVNGIGSP